MPIFDEASLKRYTEQSLAELLPGKRGAVVAVATLDGTVEVRYAHRINGNWTVGAVIRKEAGQPPEGGVRVMWSW